MSDLTGKTDYTYNDAGEITGVRQGDGSIIKYAYDNYGNIKQLTYPDGSKVTYQYDALDQLTAVIDKDKHQTTYTYDDAGNMTEIKRADGTSSIMSYRLDDRIEKSGTSIKKARRSRHMAMPMMPIIKSLRRSSHKQVRRLCKPMPMTV